MIKTVRYFNGDATEHTFRNKREKCEVSHESDLENDAPAPSCLVEAPGRTARRPDGKPTPAHQFTYSYLALTKCCSFAELT